LIILGVDINVAPLYQELLIDLVAFECFIEVIKSLVVILHESVGFTDALEDTWVFRA
jgi:hypothetical protein